MIRSSSMFTLRSVGPAPSHARRTSTDDADCGATWRAQCAYLAGNVAEHATFARHTATAACSPRCGNLVIAGDTKPTPSRCIERIASASIGLSPRPPVDSDHDNGAEAFPSPGCNDTANLLWLRVTESSIEVIEAAIAATPPLLAAPLREHLAALYATRDLTRSAIEELEKEPPRSAPLTEQLPALEVDQAAIEMGITHLTAMIPTASPPHRRELQDELLKYVRARDRTRSAILQAANALAMQHAGIRRATARQHGRPRRCAAQSVRHSRSSRSSRRTARVARAAKRATADPDGARSAHPNRGAIAEETAFVVDAMKSLRDEVVPARDDLRTISWAWRLSDLRFVHQLLSCYNSVRGCQEGRDADPQAHAASSKGAGGRSPEGSAANVAVLDQVARREVNDRRLHHRSRSGFRGAPRTAFGSWAGASW